jgi:hypothetical protein
MPNNDEHADPATTEPLLDYANIRHIQNVANQPAINVSNSFHFFNSVCGRKSSILYRASNHPTFRYRLV